MIDRKKVDLWNSQRIGLVLSGGGAKGAYQAGAFMALYELDIADKVTVVSGTSIGALNALLFAMQSKYLCKKMWGEISFKDILSPLDKEDRPTLKKIIRAVNSEGSPDFEKLAQLADELVNPESTPFTLEGVRKLFTRILILNVFVAASLTCMYALIILKTGEWSILISRSRMMTTLSMRRWLRRQYRIFSSR